MVPWVVFVGSLVSTLIDGAIIVIMGGLIRFLVFFGSFCAFVGEIDALVIFVIFLLTSNSRSLEAHR
jgi:hypothetical protein